MSEAVKKFRDLVNDVEQNYQEKDLQQLLTIRKWYKSMTEKLNKQCSRIDKLIAQRQIALQGTADLQTVTAAILAAEPAKPKPEIISWAKTGLPCNKDIKVICHGVKRVGHSWEFTFEIPENGRLFKLTRSAGPLKTEPAKLCARHTVKHLTGRWIDKENVYKALCELADRPIKANVVILVTPVSGCLNFQTRGNWKTYN